MACCPSVSSTDLSPKIALSRYGGIVHNTGRRSSCRLSRARRKSGKVREYAQNHIGSRGNALRNVRNARGRRGAPRGGREKGLVLTRKGQNGSHRRGRCGYFAHQGGDHRAGLYGRQYSKSAIRKARIVFAQEVKSYFR